MSTFESSDGSICVYNTREWVDNNEKDFKPPVCNKCMFPDQLKVFFVGGPNDRKDFHLEEGEEIFYQTKGDMTLKVVEKGARKDIQIKEGELFLLPAYVEHSPRRFENTLGCVVERERTPNERDCIRYFLVDSDEPSVLWERWFHLKDVVKDLPPFIKEFNESEENKTGRRGEGSFAGEKAAYKPKDVTLPKPINLDDYIHKNLDEINKKPHPLFADQGTNAELILYGNGMHNLNSGNSELVLLFLRGEGILEHQPSDTTTIKPFYTTRIKPNVSFTLNIKDGVCLAAKIVPPK